VIDVSDAREEMSGVECGGFVLKKMNDEYAKRYMHAYAVHV